jgi:catechol 2,3-dioxygenase-like lactoylglutathione lyase family enzyme
MRPDRRLATVPLLVRDYDEAKTWFVETLDFTVVEDTDLGGGKRWLVVRPRGEGGASVLLARAVTPDQVARIGDQGGGRVMLFLETDDFNRDYAAMRAAGVRFAEEPRDETYGRVAVFTDLYGNRRDLLQRR